MKSLKCHTSIKHNPNATPKLRNGDQELSSNIVLNQLQQTEGHNLIPDNAEIEGELILTSEQEILL
jgi:hypothetical protein